MKLHKLTIILILIFLSTGCWNYRELNEVSIVEAIGIDKIDDQYSISVQVINAKMLNTNSSSGGNATESPFTIYEATGETIDDALDKILLVCPKELYLGQMNLLALGEEIAKEGISEIFDFFMRDNEVRKIFPVIIVKGDKAVNALKVIPPIKVVNSINIKSIAESNKKITGFISNRLFDEVLMCYYVEGRYPTVTAVEILKESDNGENVDNISKTDDNTKVKIIGSAIFLKDKLKGYLEDNDSLAYNLLRNTLKRMTISFACDDQNNYGTVAFNTAKLKIIPELKNNTPSAKIMIDGTAVVTEYNCKIDLLKEKSITQIEDMLKKELINIVDNGIYKIQKVYKSDVIGIGERFYKDENKYWKEVSDKWDEIFPSLKISTDAKIKINRISSTVEQAQIGS